MANILVVEDERLIARLLKETLQVEGYEVVTILRGEDAIQYTLRETPHLVLLDMRLPDMDGYRVVSRLRANPKTMHIPVILLSNLRETSAKVRAFELGADDYITRPFDTDELIARVRIQLRRVRQNFLSPLIGLPGGYQVELAIKRKLACADPWSLLYLDLDNFKAFNDAYGFLTGNDLLRLVGHICQRVVRDYGNPGDFVGHIGGDDFVIVTTPDRSQLLSHHISAAYKLESRALYHPEDLRRNSFRGIDRQGRPYQFPLVSLSIGVVNNRVHRSHTLREVSHLAAAAKCQAKQAEDSLYCHECTSPDCFSSSSILPVVLTSFTPSRVQREPGILNIPSRHLRIESEQEVY